MSEINRYIQNLLGRQNLTSDDVARAMQIMTLGGSTPAQSSAFLTAIKMKGYTSEEIAGAISFISLKIRIPNFQKPAVFISATTKHADSWLGAALILSSLNIPTYLQFERTEDMHVGNILNIDLEPNMESVVESLQELGITALFQPRPKIFRNILPISQELEFVNLFDIAYPCSSPIEPLAIVYEQQDHTDPILMINSINHTACHAATVVQQDGKALRLSGQKLYQVEDLNSFVEPHKIGPSEKAARLRAFLHSSETLNEHDIYRKTAEVLLLVNAAASIDDGIRIATQAAKERQLHTILDKLVHISNSMDMDDADDDESVENV